jgi:hypothetical protein
MAFTLKTVACELASIQNLHTSPYIIRVIKSRMRSLRHVVHVEEMRNAHNILVANLKESDHLVDLGG